MTPNAAISDWLGLSRFVLCIKSTEPVQSLIAALGVIFSHLQN
jgi:hypothetical protein